MISGVHSYRVEWRIAHVGGEENMKRVDKKLENLYAKYYKKNSGSKIDMFRHVSFQFHLPRVTYKGIKFYSSPAVDDLDVILSTGPHNTHTSRNMLKLDDMLIFSENLVNQELQYESPVSLCWLYSRIVHGGDDVARIGICSWTYWASAYWHLATYWCGCEPHEAIRPN